MVAPGVLRVTLYVRNAAMIENELNVGRKVGEGNSFRNLMRQDAKIEGEAGAREPLDVFAEKRLLREVIGNHVQHPPETFDKSVLLLPLEIRGEAFIFRAASRDRAFEEASGLTRKTRDLARFEFDLSRVDVHFHMQRGGNADALCLRRIGGIEKIAIERGNAGEPRIVERGFVDQMQMRVDDQGCSSSSFKQEVDLFGADQPCATSAPASAESCDAVLSRSDMVSVISGAEGLLTREI